MGRGDPYFALRTCCRDFGVGLEDDIVLDALAENDKQMGGKVWCEVESDRTGWDVFDAIRKLET